MSTNKVLVTGANGQLGKTISELYKSNTQGLDFTFASKSELNIADQDMVSSFFKNNHFDYCINCAAYTDVEQAEKTPQLAFKINAEAVKNLAEVCKTNSVILIHISTDYVFDGEKTTPYEIDDLTNPINQYGKSKLMGEQNIQQTLSEYFIVRTSWLYSKKYGKNFYRTIQKLAETKDELAITTSQTGCPTDAESLTSYIVQLILNQSTDYGIKHFSDKEIMTWFDFAKMILIENGLLTKIKLVKSENYRTFATRPKYSVLKN